MAIEKGNVDAKIIPINNVVVANWVGWKCKFGCPKYGKSLMCPPHSPNPEQTQALLKDYEYAILLRMKSDWLEAHNFLVSVEHDAFLEGNYSALGLTSGACQLCEKCDVDGGLCIKPELARPSMESCGINVFSTAKNAGFNMKVLSSKDQKWHRFCLVLIR